MKNHECHTVRKFEKFVERSKIDTLIHKVHHRSFTWLGTGTSPECADGSDEDADFCSNRKFLICVLENKGVWPVICEGWHKISAD
jgi:hypothetical protein